MIEEWFKTPIHIGIATNFKNLQKEISSCTSQIDFKKHPDWGGQNHSLSSPNFDQNIITKFNLTQLKNEIETQVINYTKGFSNTKYNIIIEDCWIANTAPKEHTVVHNHGTTHISGVYYFKTNEKDGNIYFLNPITSLMNSHFLVPDDYVEYPPKEGLFLLFPSWLFHGVRSNDTKDNRISISFNVTLTKDNTQESKL